MFTHKTHVGRKFGGWILSAKRFETAGAAEADILVLERAAMQAGLSQHTRRVVAA